MSVVTCAVLLGVVLASGCGLCFEGFLWRLAPCESEESIIAALLEDPNSCDPNFYDPNHYDPNFYDPLFYDPNHYDPNFYDPLFYDPNDYDPNFYNPLFYDPNDYDPNFYNPLFYDPNHYDPNFYDPLFYDPNDYDPNFYDPLFYDPNHYDPNFYDPLFYDPNHYDPNFYNPLFYDPNHYDPNFYDPNYVTMLTLAGVWESTLQERTTSWEDPNALLAQAFEAQGNPFSSIGEETPGLRDFVVFDSNNAMVANYLYDPNENTVYVRPPGDDPFTGVPFVLQDDGTFRLEDVMMEGDMGNGIYLRLAAAIVITMAEDGQSVQIEQEFTVDIEALQEIPGSPAIPAGEEAHYLVSMTHVADRSPSVGVLFPDAEWQMEQGESSMTTGYVEVTGPSQSQIGWDPNSNALLAGMVNDPNSLPTSAFASDRIFVLFDETGRLIATYDYFEAGPTVEVSRPEGNPFIGTAPETVQGGWRYTALAEAPGSPLSVRFGGDVIIYEGDLSEGRQIVFSMQMVFTASVEIDLGGGDVIPAGATATYVVYEAGMATASESPYDLFPDADFVLAP